MTKELGVSDVQTYDQSFHILCSVYFQLAGAEAHFFPNFFQRCAKAFGDLFVSGSSLEDSIPNVSILCVAFGTRIKSFGRHALIVVDMTPVKREKYLSPSGMIEKRSEKDIRLSENAAIFSFALPNPMCLLFSQSCAVFLMIDRKPSMFGGPLISESSSLYSGYLL